MSAAVPSNENVPTVLPVLRALRSGSEQAQVVGDSKTGFVLQHPYGREVYDRHGQPRSERNEAYAALPATGELVASYPLEFVYVLGLEKRKLKWVLTIHAPKPKADAHAAVGAAPMQRSDASAAPMGTQEKTKHVLSGDLRFDLGGSSGRLDFSAGFAPSLVNSSCGRFELFEEGRWSYELDVLHPNLSKVAPGLQLVETFELRSRKGQMCEVSLLVSHGTSPGIPWIIEAQTRLL